MDRDVGAPLLLLPRACETVRLDGRASPARPDLRFPERLLTWGAPPDVFRTTLGARAAPCDEGSAHVLVRARQDHRVRSPLGYCLETTGEPRPRAVIHAATIEGARSGLHTLAQLFRRFGATLPWVRIIDWPALATRGVMLDVSRCRIPTMAEFHRVIPLLASLKFNHLQLYTEHTFAYPGHESVWEGWDPITAAEVRELSALCALHGINLAANQNTFGHMKHWLDHPRYAPLAETHDDFDFYGMIRRGPFSLCPTDPAARTLACSLLDGLVPNFSPDAEGRTLVNVGCDETADVGAGRSKDAVARLGKGAVYAGHVGAIMRHCLERGWTPQFWGDIALAHPEVLAHLPPEAIPLAWGYEPDSPFERWGSALAQSGRRWWVCPGTSSWRSITGRTAERTANVEGAARAGVALGASGFMVCDWGDVGHMQQWPVALNALAHAADAAWTGGRAGYDPRAASLHALGDASLALAPFLDELGDADLPIRIAARGGDASRGLPPLRNASALFTAIWPARPELADAGSLAPPEAWEEVVERLGRLSAARPVLDGPEGALVGAEVGHTIDWAMWAARVSCALSSRRARRPLVPQALRSQVTDLERAHAGLWLRRSRRGPLWRSCAFWQDAARRLQTF